MLVAARMSKQVLRCSGVPKQTLQWVGLGIRVKHLKESNCFDQESEVVSRLSIYY